jgi:uncharacterized membrane protein
MSDLIVIGYPDEQTAPRVWDELRSLQRDYLVDLEDGAVIIHKPGGKFEVRTSHQPMADQAMWGLFWGFLIGLIFFVPLLGMAFGAATGAIFGAIEKTAINKQFRDRVREMIKPGTSAILVIVRKVTPDRFLEALRPYGGTVLRTSLSHEDEQRLQEALHGRAAPAGIKIGS